MFGWLWTQVTSQPRVCCPERAGQWAFQERVQPVRVSRGRWPHALRLHTAVTQNSSHFTPHHWPGGGAGPAGGLRAMGRQGKSNRRRRLLTGLVWRAADGFPTRLEPGGLQEAEAKGPLVTSCHLGCAPGCHTPACLFKRTMCKTISHSASGRGPERQGRQPRDTRRPERPGPGAPTPSEAPAWLVAGRLAV